jgi:hypothetical protein
MIMAFTSTRLGLRSSFLAAGLLTILVPALFSAENLATDPYIDLVDSKFDKIYLRNGSQELGTDLQLDKDGNYSLDGVKVRRRFDKKEVLKMSFIARPAFWCKIVAIKRWRVVI